MKRFFAVLSLIFTFAFSTLGMAQSRRYATEQSWVENFRVVTGVGTMNFLGDLGGSNDIGRSFLADWDWEAVRPVIQLGARYQWHRRFATRASFNFGWTVGKDAWSEDPARNARNLSFHSFNFEWGFLPEFYFLPDVPLKGRYRRRGVTGKSGRPVLGYIYTGIVGFTMNPMARNPYDGQTYALQPLGTEGQFVLPTRDPYSLVQIAIPIGVGFSFKLTNEINLDVEVGWRRTFTDYMDDVSSTYVDPNLFGSDVAKQLSIGTQAYYLDQTPEPGVQIFGPGDQRGNPQDNDTYMFFAFNLSWKLTAFQNSAPKYPR
jgi:hypothetical protein